MKRLRAFFADESGASSAEFVLILPVLAVLIFGVIDVGGYAFRLNTLEKATQAGARFAVTTSPVDSGLNYDFATSTTNYIPQGNLIPASTLGVETCTAAGTTSATSVTCSCAPACVWTSSGQTTAFNNILARMKWMDPNINASNVQIEYRGTGMGYSGDPGGMQIAPLVTVRLVNMKYKPIAGYIFNRTGGFGMPDFAYSLTMEDGSGTRSN